MFDVVEREREIGRRVGERRKRKNKGKEGEKEKEEKKRHNSFWISFSWIFMPEFVFFIVTFIIWIFSLSWSFIELTLLSFVHSFRNALHLFNIFKLVKTPYVWLTRPS